MPELDYAFLCDYVRAEHGIAHVIAAGIDTVRARTIPTGRNVGLLVRLDLEENEIDKPLELTLRFQNEAGESLAQVDAQVVASAAPEEDADGGPRGALVAINFGLFFPDFGRYRIVVELAGTPLRTLPLRVIPAAET